MKKRPITKNKEPSLEEALLAFRRKVSGILRQEAEDLHCSVSQIDTLSYIADKGNPTMKEIANYLKITPPSTTAIIEIMQKKKLINRVSNEKDRRTIRVTLTPKAWKFFKELHNRKLDIFKKMFSKLEDTERRQLTKILNILTKD
ncbi:MAG: MarR family transcriptional regulator [Patescibacteria group bacterium]|nr:MarR family transcriptional regulator [Patescibacteria group bacterium]